LYLLPPADGILLAADTVKTVKGELMAWKSGELTAEKSVMDGRIAPEISRALFLECFVCLRQAFLIETRRFPSLEPIV
jgi:hypothetical protein